MGRYKPDVNELKNLEDADRVLKELCALEAEIERIDADGEAAIAKIKEKTANAGKLLRERVKELSATLKAFADYHKGEFFKDPKSVERSFGVIGYRRTPPSISTSKNTVELLKKLGMKEFIRVREEADKEAMLSLEDDKLAQVEAVKKSKEEFFVKLKRETVNKDLLESA